MSLKEFAAANPGRRTGNQVWLTSIPEWPEIRDGYLSGIPGPVIRRWLITPKEEGGGGYDPAEVTDGRWQALYKTCARIRDDV